MMMKVALIALLILLGGCMVKAPLYVCQVIGEGTMGCAPYDPEKNSSGGSGEQGRL